MSKATTTPSEAPDAKDAEIERLKKELKKATTTPSEAPLENMSVEELRDKVDLLDAEGTSQSKRKVAAINRVIDRKVSTARKAEIEKKDISDDDKKILQQYEEGVQLFVIAKNVFKFVNNDTVGTVVNVIRKEYADDYDEVETINSYKGYTGI